MGAPNVEGGVGVHKVTAVSKIRTRLVEVLYIKIPEEQIDCQRRWAAHSQSPDKMHENQYHGKQEFVVHCAELVPSFMEYNVLPSHYVVTDQALDCPC
jgi:hypothetical protein